MNNLPVEVFKEIFMHLNQQQKLECMTVCKKWNTLIDEYCLLYSIRIKSFKKLNQLILSTITRNSQRPACQKLIIDRCSDSRPRSSHILNIIPPREQNRTTAEERRNNLARNVDAEDIIPMKLLLHSSQFRNITRLVLIHTVFEMDHISEVLVETPFLTNLFVQVWALCMERLERLHEMLPQLNELSIRTCWIYLKPSVEVKAPAPLIKLFHLEYILETIPRINFCFFDKYICRKYTNLLDFQYITKCNIFDFDVRSQRIRNATCAKLKKGLGLLLQRLGPKLQSLSIKSASFPEDVFEMMDKYKCKLSTISLRSTISNSLLRSFLKSNQIYSIRKLEFINLNDSIENLRILPHLEDLSLDFDLAGANYMVTDVKNILDACPKSLKALSLSRVILTSNGRSFSNLGLVKLKFYDCVIQLHVDKILAYSLPQLKHFITYFCTFESMKLSLLNIKLSSFYMVLNKQTLNDYYYKADLRVITSKDSYLYSQVINGDEWNYYSVYNHNLGISLLSSRRSVSIWQGDIYTIGFTLECRSVNDVYYTLSTRSVF